MRPAYWLTHGNQQIDPNACGPDVSWIDSVLYEIKFNKGPATHNCKYCIQLSAYFSLLENIHK